MDFWISGVQVTIYIGSVSRKWLGISSYLHFMGRSYRLLVLLGGMHGLSDCASGFMIGSLPQNGWLDMGAFLLLYNVLAFGGQVPAGILVDRLDSAKGAALLALGTVMAGLLLMPIVPAGAVMLAGCGSAVFHVAGGRLALEALPGKAAAPGIFAAPGVLGLALGGFLAIGGWAAMPWMLGLGAVLMILLLQADSNRMKAQSPRGAKLQQDDEHGLDGHDVLMLLLLLAIAMRSAVWNVFQLVHAGEETWLLAIGAAALVGKFAGGFAADWLGWKRYTVGALLLAVPLLVWSEGNRWLLLPGVALLQSATPAAVTALWRYMPKMPATASGMAFGLAIAAGGIPFALGLRPSNDLVWIAVPLVALGYGIAVKHPIANLKRKRT